nr:DUF2254 domain-containing protein [Luteolibacter marinus]
MWIKPALTGLGAAVWIELALLLPRHLHFDPPFEIDRDLLLSLLQILASTMLTVAIFAVSAMVAAFSSVTTTATPRATRIVMQDRSSQNALAAFLSAFIYAIIALVALSAVPYGDLGRFALFVGYVFTVVWVLVSFVRWVDQVSKLGRMNDTIQRVEEACHNAFTDPAVAGTLGAMPATGDDPDGEKLRLSRIGYLQHVDVADLQELAATLETTIRLLVRPGAFIDRNRPVAVIQGGRPLDEEARETFDAAFTIGAERHIESDPRFGLLMLAEIADRALSPAVNDPGTAIAVIGCEIRLLSQWVDASRATGECEYPDVEVPPLHASDLLDDGFMPISRDGAAMFEVGTRLQKAFRALHDLGHPGLAAAARVHSRLALEQALEKLPTAHHRDQLRELAGRAFPPQEED